MAEGGFLYYLFRDKNPKTKVKEFNYKPIVKGESIYDYFVVTHDNVNQSLKWYKKKVLLIVNMGRNSKYVNQC
jgi:hypothetical protein